ncbi:MAG TPA: flagellar hook-length control protein FliK [Candidatus Binatia bacterium]|nr:flagellar hook-length control protein FliK [Candidatus Binatia bacterium]
MVVIPATSAPVEPATAAAAAVPAAAGADGTALVLDFGAFLAALLGGATSAAPAAPDAGTDAAPETETADDTAAPPDAAATPATAIAAAAVVPVAIAPVPVVIPPPPAVDGAVAATQPLPDPVPAPSVAATSDEAPPPVVDAGASEDAPVATAPEAPLAAATPAPIDAAPPEDAPADDAPVVTKTADVAPKPAADKIAADSVEAAKLALAPGTRIVENAAPHGDDAPPRAAAAVGATAAPATAAPAQEAGTQGESSTDGKSRDQATADPAAPVPDAPPDTTARTNDATPTRHGDASQHAQHQTTTTRDVARAPQDAPPVPIRDVEQLVRLDALRPQRLPEGGEMRLEVTSPLGQIDVHVSVRNDGVNATLLADQANAREALTQQRPSLEAALGRANLRLDGFNVGTGPQQQHQSQQPDTQQGTPGWRPAPPTTTPMPTTTPEPVRTMTGGLSLRA